MSADTIVVILKGEGSEGSDSGRKIEKTGQFDNCVKLLEDLRSKVITPKEVKFNGWDENHKSCYTTNPVDNNMCICFSRILIIDSIYSDMKKTLHQNMIEEDGSYYKYSITQGKILTALRSSAKDYIIEPLLFIVFYYY